MQLRRSVSHLISSDSESDDKSLAIDARDTIEKLSKQELRLLKLLLAKKSVRDVKNLKFDDQELQQFQWQAENGSNSSLS